MTKDKVLNDNEVKENDTLFNAVVSVSVKTAFYLVLFVAIFASYLCLRLPYHAMRLYNDLGMTQNALYCAQRVVGLKRDDKKHTEALLTGIELADNLLDQQMTKGKVNAKKRDKYAKKVIFFTQNYAFSPSFYQQNALLDGYYHSQIEAAPKALLYSYLDLYSYKDYVYTLNFKACAILNKTDKILINDSFMYTSLITSESLEGLSPTSCAVFFNQISAYLSVNNQGELLAANEFSLFFSILQTADIFINRAINTNTSLQKLYLIKAVYRLGEQLRLFCQSNGYDNKLAQVDNVFVAEGISLWQFLEQEINEYR